MQMTTPLATFLPPCFLLLTSFLYLPSLWFLPLLPPIPPHYFIPSSRPYFSTSSPLLLRPSFSPMPHPQSIFVYKCYKEKGGAKIRIQEGGTDKQERMGRMRDRSSNSREVNKEEEDRKEKRAVGRGV